MNFLVKNKVIIIPLVVFLGVVVIVFFNVATRNAQNKGGPQEEQVLAVQVRSVGELSQKKAPLEILGKVESKSEATIRTESQGEISQVLASLGDTVFVGQVIAEIKNAQEHAAVLQAEGAVEQAEAQLSKTQGGVRAEQLSILDAKRRSAQQSFKEAKSSLVGAIRNGFTIAQDAIYTKADLFFLYPRGENPKVIFFTTNPNHETGLNFSRLQVEGILLSWKNSLQELDATGDLDAQSRQAQENLDRIRILLEDATLALNAAVATPTTPQATILGWKDDMTTARISVNTATSTLSSRKDALNVKEAAFKIAEKEYEQGITGGQTQDVAVAQASLKQVEAALAGADAALEKTIIRSPIAGTINEFFLEKGDFVSLFEVVAQISNNNALQIEGFITEEDRADMRVGSKVTIEKNHKGVITSIGPALEQKTKKIKVIVGVQGNQKGLIHGQTVALAIERTPQKSLANGQLFIPISALKITAQGTTVFLVDEEQRLFLRSVEVGAIVAEKIMVKEGLSFEHEIVLDARGLKEGEKVVIVP